VEGEGVARKQKSGVLGGGGDFQNHLPNFVNILQSFTRHFGRYSD
jgi:hypothetical protein